MFFKTTDAHEALRAKVRQFAENEVKPIAFLLDQQNEFPGRSWPSWGSWASPTPRNTAEPAWTC